ncbi:MAG: Peptidase propeptide [Nevskia sp.]|nr:Peptidase propeptide [Nevskia sp.]
MQSPMLKASRYLTSSALLLAFVAAADSPVALHDRIAAPLNARSSMVLNGSIHPLAQARYETGRVSGDIVLHGVSLYFARSAAQQADLEELLRQQQDPASPNYQAWLTPQQYASRFGISAADQAKITSWLLGQGFSIDSVSASGNRVSFSGSAARIESAFQTELHRYQVDGESHFANASDLSVPAALSGMVLGVRGVDDFRPKAHFRTAPRFTSSQTGNHLLAPGDLATIYNISPLYTAGLTGSGRTIAVVGQGAINLRDIQAFRSAAGLPAKDPVLTLVPNNSVPVDNGSTDMEEADIDIEWSGGMAPNATINFVYAKNVFDAMNYAIENNVAPVISISYGLCESQVGSAAKTFDSTFLQANTQGQTIVTSSGDAGAADCDVAGKPNATTTSNGLAVDFPASSPNVTGIGGTEFNDSNGTYWKPQASSDVIASALSYIPEFVWNDTSADLGLSASGGGKSSQFSKPSWQTGVGVPGDNARYVPDIALAASNGHVPYLFCTTVASTGQGTCLNGFRDNSGNLTSAGGTSFGAPVFAAILTLVAQKTGASALGNVNPRLYQLAGSTTTVFHDITSGNNNVKTTGGSTIGYSAGVGYDPTTGLGSMDVSNLANAWAGSGGSSSSSGGAGGSTGGGGGGAFAPGMLALLGTLLLGRRRRKA